MWENALAELSNREANPHQFHAKEEVAMNIKKILFPTDFSEHSDAALAFASFLAAKFGATLHIVNVFDTRVFSSQTDVISAAFASEWQAARHEAERELIETVPPDQGVAFKHHPLVGVPDSEILHAALDQWVDIIVMASHGRTGISRLLMGSVAEAVLRRASCPVLIVKRPIGDATTSKLFSAQTAEL